MVARTMLDHEDREVRPASRVKAKCLVGGCEFEVEGPLRAPLELEVEAHRQEKHDWVKPGRLHRLILDPSELPAPPPPEASRKGRAGRSRHDKRS